RPGVPQRLLTELHRLLTKKNGFYAFESSLVVLPSSSESKIPGVAEWNNPSGWRRNYEGLDRATLFFAEDAFANQYGLSHTGVLKLDPETGKVTQQAGSLRAWGRRILDDYDFETGWSVARHWQQRNGALEAGFRLLPKTPFVLGGDYVVDNLVAI